MPRLLFVCLGNICRSPAAEGVFNHRVKALHLESLLSCDSAGTSGYHQGEPADARMRAHAARRGITLTSRARQFDPQADFIEFDLILTMDEQNYADVVRLAPNTSAAAKVKRFSSFFSKSNRSDVPDPYYGGEQGFEEVLDLLQEGCENLLDELKLKL